MAKEVEAVQKNERLPNPDNDYEEYISEANQPRCFSQIIGSLGENESHDPTLPESSNNQIVSYGRVGYI